MQHCRSLSKVIISRLSTKDKTSRVANTMIRLWGCEAAGAPARLLALAHFALLCFAWQHFVLRELQLQHLQHCTHKEPELQPLFPRAAATWSPPPQVSNSPATLGVLFPFAASQFSSYHLSTSITNVFCSAWTQFCVYSIHIVCYSSSSWFGKFYPNFTPI